MRYRCALLVLFASLAACQSEGENAFEHAGYESESCEPGAIRSCFFERHEGNEYVCQSGVSTCGSTGWGACEPDGERYAIRTSALITGPTECSPCDPACGIAIDTPTSGDLNDDNSDSVEYSPEEGGVTIEQDSEVTRPDRDGDGILDDADDYPDDPSRDGVRENGGFAHTLAPGEFAVDPLEVNIQVRTADVYFLVDTTGSMGGELNNLKAQLTSGSLLPGCPGGLIGAIRCTIPGADFGVGSYDDYPVRPFGWYRTDRPYIHHQNITSSTGAAQSAVNSLRLHSGWDGPESSSQALWAMATGGGLGPYLSAAPACPGDRWGYPCFRDRTIPIVIHITDAPSHNGPGNQYPYYGIAGARSWGEMVTALNNRSIRVITVHSGRGYGISHANALADATGAFDSAGSRYVFPIPPDGTGLSQTIVDAVVDLANYSRMDISLQAADNSATAFDERELVNQILATGWNAGSCLSFGGTQFEGCLPGTDVDFSVTFRNNTVPLSSVTQVFNFNLEVIGNGSILLQTIPVRIAVPPTTVYGSVGTYWRDYDGTQPFDNGVEACRFPETRPYWGQLQWNIAPFNSNESLTFEIRTADTLAGLPSASPTLVEIPPQPVSGSVNIGSLLEAAGELSTRPYLRVTAVLRASSDLVHSPVLRSFSVQYNCIDST